MDSTLQRRALRLSYFTVGYNLIEGIVSIAAGLLAGSVALVGFGLDSFVESLSGTVMIWRFSSHPSNQPGGRGAARGEGRSARRRCLPDPRRLCDV